MSMAVALMTLGDPERLTGGYLYHRRVAELAPRHGATMTFVPLPEGTLRAAVAARGCLKRAVAADVVVCDSIVAGHLAPYLSRPRSTPVVGMLHQPPGGIDGGGVRRALRRPFDRSAYRRMPLLLVASELLRDQMLDEGLPDERIVVVAPGRDAPPPEIAEEGVADLRRGRRVAFLCVGNWMARKGITELLDALALLPPELATLHLVGDDSVEPRYARRVRLRLADPSITSRVVVHGPVSRSRVDAFYRAADAFVLPSLKEPYGTVYGEAMAAGLPVIGWRAGNLPYLIDDGREGLMAAPGDVTGLAAAMTRMAQDDPLRTAMATAALATGSALPTWEEAAATFFVTLRRVAAR